MKAKKNRILLPVVLLVCVLFASILTFGTAKADAKLNIYLFFGSSCNYCKEERAFLTELLPKYPQVYLHDYEIFYNQANVELMRKVFNELSSNINSVPYLIIGDKEIVGYSGSATDLEIENRIKECLSDNCPDTVASVVGTAGDYDNGAVRQYDQGETLGASNDNKEVAINQEITSGNTTEKTKKIPIFGAINVPASLLSILAIVGGLLMLIAGLFIIFKYLSKSSK